MVDKKFSLDDIDISLLEILRKNPRESLRKISKDLAKFQFKATPETIRKRIIQLYQCIEFQPIPNMELLGYDQAILLIKVRGGQSARKIVVEKIKSTGFNICETIGSFDIICYFPLRKNSDLRNIVDMVKNFPEVIDVTYLMMASHHTSISPLLAHLRQ